MPFTDRSPLPGLASTLQTLNRRLDDLEAKTRNLGNGSIVATDTAGTVRMVIGSLGGSVWGMQLFDANGKKLIQEDSTGLSVFNATGTLEAMLGKIDTSPDIYGLAVLPTGGTHLQQVAGLVSATGSTLTNQTNTSWATIPNSTVTAVVGPSGQALVTITCQVATGGASQEGFVAISIDSGTPTGGLAVSASTAVNLSSSSANLYNGLSPGSHTFALATEVTAGANCSFYSPIIVVQPL